MRLQIPPSAVTGADIADIADIAEVVVPEELLQLLAGEQPEQELLVLSELREHELHEPGAQWLPVLVQLQQELVGLPQLRQQEHGPESQPLPELRKLRHEPSPEQWLPS